MNRLYFIIRVIYTFIHSMVVKTRSYYYSKQEEEQQQQPEQQQRHKRVRESSSSSPSCSADSINITTSVNDGGRRVRITTPSFHEASIRSYKVYTPTIKPKHRRNNKEREEAEAEAVEALLTLQQQDADYACESSSPIDEFESETMSSSSSSGSRSGVFETAVKHTCMNPMNPITNYMYRICVYNLERTAHLKTAYILYDPKSRMFHVHTIISNQIDHHHHHHSVEHAVEVEAGVLPEPKNTLQMKFAAFVGDTISNYVMSLIIPSKEYDYYIQDDIIGLVSSNNCDTVFGEDSSFYDIERLLYDQSSTLTTNGFKAFMLLPSRQFWYSSYYYSASGAPSDNRYMYNTIDSSLIILAQSH